MVELDKLPLYELHTMYYAYWKEREEESKMTKDQQGAVALSKALEDSM